MSNCPYVDQEKSGPWGGWYCSMVDSSVDSSLYRNYCNSSASSKHCPYLGGDDRYRKTEEPEQDTYVRREPEIYDTGEIEAEYSGSHHSGEYSGEYSGGYSGSSLDISFMGFCFRMLGFAFTLLFLSMLVTYSPFSSVFQQENDGSIPSYVLSCGLATIAVLVNIGPWWGIIVSDIGLFLAYVIAISEITGFAGLIVKAVLGLVGIVEFIAGLIPGILGMLLGKILHLNYDDMGMLIMAVGVIWAFIVRMVINSYFFEKLWFRIRYGVGRR